MVSIVNPSTPITANFFLNHLGKSLESIDPEVFKYAHKPDFSLPEHSPIGGIFFTKQGFSITFCSPEFYHVDARLTLAPAIITNVQFYSGDPLYGQSRCESPLPHGIAFTDGRSALLEKFGPSPWRFPFVEPIKLERWDFPDHWLLVRYTDNMNGLRQIQIGLKPKKQSPTVLPKIEQPDIHVLQSMFEHRWEEVAAHPDLADADFSEVASASDGSHHEVDELKTRGVEFYFRQSKKKDESFYILSGARYIRKGLFFSTGFDGDLPQGLQFCDTPEVAIKKVGVYPVTGNADELGGYYVWRLPEYMLHVQYSVMEQRINRIYVAAHPYYAAELLESPLLEMPANNRSNI